mmetsp:Transcript_57742/g.159224  ORF Transcript_57742/g.159224 Transcript_57742/m.159224 type:complete len:263 (+) Transcript_57742:387-1175(+)
MATPLDMQQNPLHSGAAVDSKSSPTSDNRSANTGGSRWSSRSSGRSLARSSSRNLESSDKCYVPGSPLPKFPSNGESVPTAQSGSQRMAALTRRAVQSVWRDPQRNADERKRTSSRMANFPTMSGVYGRGSNHLGAGDKDIVAHMPSDRFSENQDTGGISANERGEEDGLELMATNEEDQRKHEIEQAGFTLLKGFKLHFAMPETEVKPGTAHRHAHFRHMGPTYYPPAPSRWTIVTKWTAAATRATSFVHGLSARPFISRP